MDELEWDVLARELFDDLMRHGPPEALRDSATAVVHRQAERFARTRGAVCVDRTDVARACLRVAPAAFLPRVRANLARRGFDVAAIDVHPGPSTTTSDKEERVFDSEWDRIHDRIITHRDELARIYRQRPSDSRLRVLDLACGTGKHLIELARDGHRCHGVDQQAWKLEKAGQRARDEGLVITFSCADIRELQLTDEFDVVLCLYAISVLRADEDLLAAFATVKRALAENGVFIFNVINKAVNQPGGPMWASVHDEQHLRDHERPGLEALLARAGLALKAFDCYSVMGAADLDVFVTAAHGGSRAA
jgi:SAM-dependent methyltransferase